METNNRYGLTILRVVVGLLFLVPGIMKLMNPAGPTGMLTGLGFPAPQILVWVLLLSEIIFGIALILGFKTKYTVWPLMIVFAVVLIFVAIPGALSNPAGWTNVIFHLLGIASLLIIFLEGPGALAIGR